MANLGLPSADTRCTWLSSCSNNVIPGSWPATVIAALFQPQLATVGNNNTNPFNWLGLDNDTTLYDDAWDGRFYCTYRNGAAIPTPLDPQQVVTYALIPPIPGVYNICLELNLGAATVPNPAQGTSYEIETYVMICKNYGQYFNYSQTTGNAGPPGCYQIGGTPQLQRVPFAAGAGAPAGAPAYGPGGAELLAVQHVSALASAQTVNISTLGTFNGYSDNLSFIVYLNVTPSVGAPAAAQRPITYSSLQISKVADSPFASGYVPGLTGTLLNSVSTYTGTNIS